MTSLFTFIACATCTGSRGETADQATAGAILLMLVILVAVFGGVFQFMRYLRRCERRAIARVSSENHGDRNKTL